MYAVSDAYKLAVADSHRKSRMRAEIKTDNGVIVINDGDIIKDTVYVTNQCTNGNEYEYGCVYSAECGITIKSNTDRYDLYGAELRVWWSLWTGDGWEEIPLGVFYITEPNRINEKISIKALDGMVNLDSSVDEDTQGTLPELMAYIATKCGVELAQTADELSAFVNAGFQYSVQADDVDTYRDILAYLGMMSAAFATFDRSGKLKLVKYAKEPCATIGEKQRFKNATFSDYKTKYRGVKARFIANENYAPYSAKATGKGLTLDMGDIPIVRGVSETKKEMLKAVLDVLKEVSYTPFSIETLGNPALDLGDYVENTNVGSKARTYSSPITYSYWTYRGKHKLKGVGGNPKVASVKSRRDKMTSTLEGFIDGKSVVVKEFSNAGRIEFSETEQEIAVINFATTEDCKPVLLFTVRLNASLDGVLVIQFYTNGIAENQKLYKQYLDRGDNIVTIAECYDVKENTRNTIKITARMEYFESDTRKQSADIATQNNFLQAIEASAPTVSDNLVVFPTYEKVAIDTTVSTGSIEVGGVKVIVFGQGVAGDGKWDGTIDFMEEIGLLTFGSIPFSNVSGVLSSKLEIPAPVAFGESLGKLRFGSIAFNGLHDSVSTGRIVCDYTFSTLYADRYTYDKFVTCKDGAFTLENVYKYESEELEIDSGKMCSVAMDLSGLNVESVVIENG